MPTARAESTGNWAIPCLRRTSGRSWSTARSVSTVTPLASKIAWGIFEREAEAVGGRILLSVHDSFELSLPVDVDPLVLRDRVQAALRAECHWFKIPLVIDFSGEGPNYFEATKK